MPAKDRKLPVNCENVENLLQNTILLANGRHV